MLEVKVPEWQVQATSSPSRRSNFQSYLITTFPGIVVIVSLIH